MRLSRAATVSSMLGLALILGSCGGGGTTTAERPTQASNAVSTPTRAPSTARVRAGVCRAQLGGFVGSMARLRDELARGLDYDAYLGGVRATRVIYAAIRPQRVPAACLLASGGPAERAFNLYIDAANAWGDCLATVACDTHGVEPRLQRKWALAARQLSLAQRGLRTASG
jgi:hypothetical protein